MPGNKPGMLEWDAILTRVAWNGHTEKVTLDFDKWQEIKNKYSFII